jgi:hypothetical protein
MKTKTEIIADILGVDEAELCLEDLLNRHVPLLYVLQAMDEYADQGKQQIDTLRGKVADALKANLDGDMPRLLHKETGNVGVFIKEYRPTGCPMSTQIQLEDGRVFYAPSSEFEIVKKPEK